MAFTDYKLKFIIDADGRTAKQELDALQGRISGLGGGFATAFGGAIPVIGAVGTVIAGVTTASASLGVALFNLTKQASEYGSTIYDASVQTGLGAETLSALDLAAEQSGSSLEQLTGGVARFAKQVGAAVDGSDKARKALKDLGIDPQAAMNDLDGALAKVFKRIGDARPGVERMTLAQKAFGKAGAELLPLMEQTNFDLAAFTRRAKELGVTIDDEAARAADEFGDQLDLLNRQLKFVGITIGNELMPEFIRMAEYVSKWLGENKDEIEGWGNKTANVLRGLIEYWNDASGAIARYAAESRALGSSPFGTTSSGGNPWWMYLPPFTSAALTNDAFAALNRRGAEARANDPQQYGPFSWEMNKPLPKTLDTDKETGKAAKDVFKLGPQGQAFVKVANKLGISALDLATIVGFETAGTYSTSITNKQGYTGLIQFGKDERKEYGAYRGQPFEQQLEAAGRFLADRFAKAGRTTAGASLLDLYRTVLGGSPTASLTTTDANKTSPLSGVAKMLREHRPAALERFFGGKESNIPKDDWGSLFGRFSDVAAKEAKEAADAFEAAQRRKFDIARSTSESLIQFEEMYYSKAFELADSDAAIAAAQRIRDRRAAMAEDEVVEAERVANAQVLGSEEAEEAYTQFMLARIRANIEIAQADEELERRNKQIDDARTKRLEEQYELIRDRIRANDELYESELRLALLPTRFIAEWDLLGPEHEKAMANQGRSQFDKLRERFKEQSQVDPSLLYDSDAFKDQAAIAGIEAMETAFRGLADAIGSAVQAWVLYGSAGQSARQVAAQIIASVAQMAAVKAVFELAEGFAALARGWFGNPAAFKEAAMHFKSAATYGIVAGVAAGIGRGVAGNSFQQQGGQGGGSAGGVNYGSSSAGGGQRNEPLQPISRVSDDAFLSGRRNSDQQLADAINRFVDKYDSMPAGELLVKGVREKKGLILQTVANEARSNPRPAQDFVKTAGIR